MTYTIPEILEMIEKAKTKEEKVNLFLQYQSDPLIVLMRLNFDPMLWMDLPEGDPLFKKETDVPVGHSPSNIYKEFRRFYLWLSPQNISKVKKETLFIELLESIHHTEAEVLLLCKDRKLETKFKTITEDIVRQAFPNALTSKENLPKQKKEKAKAPLA